MKKSHKSTEFVSLKELSKELGLDRSNMRKYVLSQGVKFHKRRTADSKNQLTLAMTVEEAEFIRRKRDEQGFSRDSKLVITDTGVFYIIQLVPELDPRRIKLGFADSIQARLAQHRTAAPTAIVVHTWPCRRSWEHTVIDCLSAKYCKIIMNEVFECRNIRALKLTADKLFALLPSINAKRTLSKHSPYK